MLKAGEVMGRVDLGSENDWVVWMVDAIAASENMASDEFAIVGKIVNVNNVASKQDPHLAFPLRVDFDAVLRVFAHVVPDFDAENALRPHH